MEKNKMETNKNFTLSENELAGLFRLVEAQRELVYHLHHLLKHKEETLKELKMIEMKASEVQRLTNHSKGLKNLTSLTEEERKTINNMLMKKHIRI
jgi:uncharacterized protein YehS (DUF1456 family)